MNSKLLKKKQLKLYSIKFKKQKKKIILVHGVFDVIHLDIFLTLKRQNLMEIF